MSAPQVHVPVLGEVQTLTRQEVAFSAVISPAAGITGTALVRLQDASGLRHLIWSHANLEIDSSSLTVRVVGPVSQTKITTAWVCLVPSGSALSPASPAQIATVPGNCFIQHTLLGGATVGSLGFGPEVSHRIKPDPVVGSSPSVAYHYSISGGAATDTVLFQISGRAHVSGVGAVQTW